MKKTMMLLVAATVTLIGCSKSKEETSIPEAKVVFSLDGKSFGFEGHHRCYIAYSNDNDLHRFRFVAQRDGEFVNFYTNTAASSVLQTGEYHDQNLHDWQLAGLTDFRGTGTVKITRIKDGKYHYGTITGSMSYKTSSGQRITVPIENGKFENLQLR